MMQTVLIVDDDAVIAEGLGAVLECDGRELVLCSDLEAAQIAIEHLDVAFVLTDVRLTSAFRFEGLDFIEHVKRHAPSARVAVMTGATTEGLAEEARARGAAAVLAKPFEPSQLDALIGAPTSNEPGRVVRMPTLDSIIASGNLVPRFQAIVDLGSETPFGYESLARFDTDTIFARPDALFDYAHRKGRVAELELACIGATFAEAVTSPPPRLFLNIHPAAMRSESLAPVLIESAAAAGIVPERVVLEITEQESLGDAAQVARQCEQLRARGFAFALDDVGVAYSHLTHIDAIRPQFLKVSQEFGTSFESDATRTKIVRNVLSLARELGCGLVLEGIETEATRDAARAAGIPLGQGFLFGRPSLLPQR